jgi:hypothetical protein
MALLSLNKEVCSRNRGSIYGQIAHWNLTEEFIVAETSIMPRTLSYSGAFGQASFPIVGDSLFGTSEECRCQHPSERPAASPYTLVRAGPPALPTNDEPHAELRLSHPGDRR